MGSRVGWLLLALALAACTSEEKKEERMDRKVAASGFVPPAVMTRLDFGGIVERRFRRLDLNGDNFLDQSEIPPAAAASIQPLDADHDGRVSEQEFSNGMLARFDAQDTNKDGSVTTAERHLAGRGAAR